MCFERVSAALAGPYKQQQVLVVLCHGFPPACMWLPISTSGTELWKPPGPLLSAWPEGVLGGTRES